MSQRKITAQNNRRKQQIQEEKWMNIAARVCCMYVEEIDTVWKHFLTRYKADKS